MDDPAKVEPFVDVDVVDVASLDDEYAVNFKKPWLVVYANGNVVECDTDEEACAIQRKHRIAHGRDPMSGESV